MNLVDFQSLATKVAKADTVSVLSSTLTVVPYAEMPAKTIHLTAAFVVRVSDNSVVPSTQHTVVLCYHMQNGSPEYGIWCGDKFLDGALPADEIDSRCEAAVEGLPSASRKAIRKELLENSKKFDGSGDCRFWYFFRKSGGKDLCVHAATAFAEVLDAHPDVWTVLEDHYLQLTTVGAAGVVAQDGMSLEELAFRCPVLFEGDRGSGKTTEARDFVDKGAYHLVELGGHEGTESPDLLGYLLQLSPQSLVWKDGPLSEAVRKAQSTQVVLMIDEMLRIPSRQLSILLTMLSPHKGMYKLRTGRVLSVEDGVATEEVLLCPVKNLCVIATTNIGAEYGVDDLDPAIAERFIPIRKDTDPVTLKGILKSVAAANGLPPATADACMTFFTSMTAAKSRGLVYRAPTTRTMVRALELGAPGGADDVKRFLNGQALLWVARDSDGQPIQEQIEMVTDAVKSSFKNL